MSALVLKMTTAASHPIIHTTKKPYYYPPNLFFPNWDWPRSSRFTLNSNNNAIEAITTQTLRHKYGWWRIAPCAPSAPNYSLLPPPLLPPPLLLHHHQNLGPRFRGPHKCLSISSSSSSSSPNSGRSENKGELSGSAEPGAGLMADMGSEDQSQSNNHEWFDSQFYPDKDELSSPIQNHHQPPPHQSPKLLTLPTILTLGRVAAVPLLITTFYVDSWWGNTATTSIFIAAAITDWLDGYLARKMRLGSAFGAFLDPVADKLMVAATLVLLCSRPNDVTAFGQVPWLLVVPSIAIIGREYEVRFSRKVILPVFAITMLGMIYMITMSAVREWAASQNTKLLEAVAVNNLGKWKTATQMIALTILLATRDSSLGGPEFVVASGVVLLYISAGLAVWSLVVYMSKIWKVLLLR